MRAPVFVMTAVLAVGAVASPALAAPPLEPLPDFPTMTFPLCDTKNGITIEQVVNKEKINVKTMRVTGTLKLRITNEDNGKSVVVNVSGPGSNTLTENGPIQTTTFEAQGRALVSRFTPQEEAALNAAGLPDVFVTSGPLKLTTVYDVSMADEDTPPVLLDFEISVPNKVRDICAELA